MLSDDCNPAATKNFILSPHRSRRVPKFAAARWVWLSLIATSLLGGACTVTNDTQSAALVTNSAMEVKPSVVVADGNSRATIAVTVRGLNGAPVAGSGVFLSSSLDESTVFQPQAPTDLSGQAIGYVVSPTAGPSTITARLGGQAGPLILATGQVTFVADSNVQANALTLTLSPARATANGNDQISVLVVGPAGQAVTLTGMHAADALAPATGSFDAAGRFAAAWSAR